MARRSVDNKVTLASAPFLQHDLEIMDPAVTALLLKTVKWAAGRPRSHAARERR
jgi:hypothetical protein